MPSSVASFKYRDLIWEGVKKNNAFLKKSNGITLTSDPLNLVGLHKKKFDGLSGKGVGLEVSQRRVFIVKNTNKAKHPKKNVVKKKIAANQTVGNEQAIKFVGEYRPDLVPAINECLGIVSKQSRVSLHLYS